MAQQIINIGEVANDGTGEPLRDAFQAVNDNFTEIYQSGPVGSNIAISGNVITNSVLNGNIVLKANGIGVIQANSSVIPSVDSVYDLGTNSLRFDTVYARYFVGNGSLLTGISGGAGNGTAIVNGTSNVAISTVNGNVTIGISGTGNVVNVSQGQLLVNGVIATPRVLTSNVVISENVSAMMVSPTTVSDGVTISLPSSSVLHIVP